MWHIERDYTSASPDGLAITRTYNSNPFNLDGGVTNTFGVRWTQEYDAVLRIQVQTGQGGRPGPCWRRFTGYTWCVNSITGAVIEIKAVTILRPDGKNSRFNRNEDGGYSGDIAISGELYEERLPDGGKCQGSCRLNQAAFC